MSFYESFIAPLYTVIGVCAFLFVGHARWPFIVAAGAALYLTTLEIKRQGGWK